jgi:hypothetical protein
MYSGLFSHKEYDCVVRIFLLNNFGIFGNKIWILPLITWLSLIASLITEFQNVRESLSDFMIIKIRE